MAICLPSSYQLYTSMQGCCGRALTCCPSVPRHPEVLVAQPCCQQLQHQAAALPQHVMGMAPRHLLQQRRQLWASLQAPGRAHNTSSGSAAAEKVM